MNGRIHHGICAAVACVVLLSLATLQARADCCDHVTINNLAGCAFTIRVTIAGNQTTWTINPGMNHFPFTMCFDVTIEVRDMCGDVFGFPETDGGCFYYNPTAQCLIHVCRLHPCEWEVTPGIQQPC